MKAFAHLKLLPGYAETSSRRRPKCPETIIVGTEECAKARCVGAALIDGRADWLAFRLGRRYFFQLRPW